MTAGAEGADITTAGTLSSGEADGEGNGARAHEGLIGRVQPTGNVFADGAVSGEIGHPGDQDWFAVTLKGNTLYRIDLKGAPSGDGTLADPYLRGIHDSRGEFLDWSWYFSRGDASGNHQRNNGWAPTNDDGGWGENSRLYFQTLYWEETYYVAVGGDGDHVGTYTLSVEQYDDGMQRPDEPGGNRGSDMTAGGAEIRLALAGPLFMRQIYGRVLSSRSEVPLVAPAGMVVC